MILLLYYYHLSVLYNDANNVTINSSLRRKLDLKEWQYRLPTKSHNNL